MYYWYVFNNRELLVLKTAGGDYEVPCTEECPVPGESAVLDVPVGDMICKAVMLKDKADITCGEWIPARRSLDVLSANHASNAFKALEMLDWNSQTLYCGHCGTRQVLKTKISKYCPQCEVETWAKLSPAVIAVICREDEILLVKSKTVRRDCYVLISGFVELGESLEECLHREVKEETGLKIKNIRYFGSQAWPFPRNVMVGYIAEYDSGELCFQEEEIESGGWFRYDALPQIPDRISISRQLIDAWVCEREKIARSH